MKVVLLADVKAQGKKGQLVDVSDGYARNFLFPKKLAVEATPDKINAVKLSEAAAIRRAEIELQEAKDLAAKIDTLSVSINAKGGTGGRLFGAITNKEIAEALKEQHGIELPKNKIVLDASIKTFGGYEVKVKLGSEISAKLKVTVKEIQ